MKKLIFPLIALLFFSGCSDDVDDLATLDIIVGDWIYFQHIEDGEDIPLDECEKLECRSYTADGLFQFTFFEEEAIIDEDEQVTIECVESLLQEGTWTNLGEGIYSFTTGTETFGFTITFDGDMYYIDEVNSITELDNNGNPITRDFVIRDVYKRK